MAQAIDPIFCKARYVSNVATCIVGVKECNAVENFSTCVCENSQNKSHLRLCLIALLSDPNFRGVLHASDF
ncbi:hypothetical protein BG011_002218 [Mortierella polycephala]|uniref:Uncharacterized protein n=1 Tax=Mortierella polycephala TaxID=41804 RepID=A0A9P6PK30_9FUNG|nr:hypothetical protein BG011_002218 [Mortierella polycephala]